MAGEMTFNLHGAEELERNLRELADIAGERRAASVGRSAARAGMKVIAEEAQRLVPVQSGELRDSIVVVSDTRGASRTGWVRAKLGFIKPGRYYAGLIEYGTRHSSAHPFVRPAMDQKAEEALRATGDKLAAGLRRAAEKAAKD